MVKISDKSNYSRFVRPRADVRGRALGLISGLDGPPTGGAVPSLPCPPLAL